MLANGEDEGIVHGEAGTLGLSDIEIVALSVRSGMASEERVSRIGALVGDREGEGERVGVGFDGVLQTCQYTF